MEVEGEVSHEDSYLIMDNNDLDLVARDYEELKRSTVDGVNPNLSSQNLLQKHNFNTSK